MPTIEPPTSHEPPRCPGHQLPCANDDNKFVDCAIVAGADYIVSEDAHFRVLDEIPFPKVCVVRLARFVEELRDS